MENDAKQIELLGQALESISELAGKVGALELVLGAVLSKHAGDVEICAYIERIAGYVRDRNFDDKFMGGFNDGIDHAMSALSD